MIRRFALLVVCLLPSIGHVLGQESPFDCNAQPSFGKYGLASLAGEKSVSRDRETPPSTMHDVIVFNLCEDLKTKEDVAKEDQCAAGTRACFTKTNKRAGADDRIIATIPLATSDVKPTYSITPLSSPKGLNLVFHGPIYPSGADSSTPPQSLNLTLLCTESDAEPIFRGYDGKQASVEWSVKAACPTLETPPPVDPPKNGDGGKDEGSAASGGGVGWFFFVLILAFVAYVAVGAYHNYNEYGATGWDLMPHRDFWRDVPHLLQDVVAHLCSSVRPGGGGRGGYHSV